MEESSTLAILVGDIHLSDRPPASCTETYTDDILDMLSYVAKLERATRADAVVWAGDVFHHKQPSRTSHATVLKLAKVAQEYENLWVVTGNHDLCVSVDTEALTDQGWKFVHELDGTEKFATLNRDTLALEWQAPLRITHQHFRGTMYSFQSESVDMLTTPNHRWFGSWREDKPLAVKTSAELFSSALGWRTPSVDSYSGDTPSTVQVGDFLLPAPLAARLFGWYVAEGTSEKGYRFTISQSRSVNPDHYAEIAGILSAAGFRFVECEKYLRVNEPSVTKFLEKHFGKTGSREMSIPRWLMGWDKPELSEFLFAYFRGDGTINGSKEERAEADYSKSSVVARTALRSLADDLSEVAVRLGYRVRISEERASPFGDSGYVGHAYEVGFTKKTRVVSLPKPQEVPERDEMVWCPTVPNETWLARRSGKMVWTGNTNDRLDSLEKQPLGVLYEAGVLQNLDGWHPTLPIFGVPWQQRWLAPGTPWEALTAFRGLDGAAEGVRPSESLVVTHAPIYPPTVADNVLFELIPLEGERGMSRAMGNGGYLYYGHIHEPHFHFEVEGTTYANMGSISRGSLHEYNLARKIQVAIWTPEHGFIPVDIPHKPASEAFKLEEAREKKIEKISLETFLTEVGSANLDISSTGTIIEHVRSMDIEEPVKAKSIELLEEVTD